MAVVVSENCEGTGRPTGWSATTDGESTGSANWDYATSPAPLAGSHSLRLTSDGYRLEKVSVGTLSKILASFVVNIPTLESASYHQVFGLYDDSLNTLFNLRITVSSGYLYFKYPEGYEYSTYAISTGTSYYIWIEYNVEGNIYLWVNTTSSKPGTALLSCSTSDTTDVSIAGFVSRNSGVTIVDTIVFDDGASGTAYNQSASGSMPASSGTLVKSPRKGVAGIITVGAGGLIRVVNKPLSGSMPSQSGSTVKSTAKEFEGQLGSVAGASLKLTAKNVSGLLPAISGVSSYVSVFLQEVLGAIPQITGAISKATTKAVTGIIPALSGSISRRAGKSLAGSIPYQAGGIVKDVDKKVQGAIPSLSGTASGVSVFLEGISGAVPYAVGSMVKMIGKGISGNAPSQAGQLVKSIAVSKTGSIPSPSGNPGEAYQTSEGTSGIFGAISGIVSYITGVIISKAVGIIGSRLKRIIGG